MNIVLYKKAMLSTLLLLCSITAYPYDFEVDGIYYNITSLADLEVEVTYATSNNYNSYSGDIVVPSTVTYNNRALSVIRIGNSAFSTSTGLTSIEIPSSVTTIGNYAFYQCTGLTSIDIPNSVTSIGNYVFSGCTGLTSIDIPNSVTSIGNYVFYGCTALTSIDLPDGLTSIGAYTFYGWTGATSFEIPENITSIGDYSFACCTALKTIKFPDNLTSIGKRAFFSCTALSAAEIPENCSSIGEYAFSNCQALQSINFPDVLTGTLDTTIVSGCSELNTLIIGSGIDTIPKNAFLNGSNLENLVFRDSPKTLFLMNDAYNSSTYGRPFYRCPLANVYVGREWEAKFGFSNSLSSMNKLTIGGYVTTIESGDYDSWGPDSIIITGNVMTVERSAFRSYLHVKYIYIGKNVTVLDDAFRFTHSLSSYSSYEPQLTDVILEDSSTPLSCSSNVFGAGTIQYVYLGRDVDASGCFSGETKITTVVIGDSVTSIAASTFSGCTELTYLTLGSGLKSIGKSAFSNCSLTELNLPNSMETISSSAFNGCDLTTISSYGVTPCEIDSTTFNSYSYINATVYVPAGSLSAYQSADNWCYFWNIVEKDNLSSVTSQTFDETKILAKDGAIIVENPTYAVSVYNLWGVLVGRRTANGGNVEIHVPSHGIYIVKVGTQTHKVSL